MVVGNCEDEKSCKTCEFYSLLKGCSYDPRTTEEIAEPLFPHEEPKKLREGRLIRIGEE